MLLLPHLTPSLLCFLDFTVVQAAATTDRCLPGSQDSSIFSTPAGNEVNPESDIPSDPIVFSLVKTDGIETYSCQFPS